MSEFNQLESNLEEMPSHQSMIDMLQKMMSGSMMPSDMPPSDMHQSGDNSIIEYDNDKETLNLISDTTNLIYDEVCAITISNDLSKDIADSMHSKIEDLSNKMEILSAKIDKLLNHAGIVNTAASVDVAPVNVAPVDTASVDTASVDTASVDTASIDTASIDTAPVDTAPVDVAPVNNNV